MSDPPRLLQRPPAGRRADVWAFVGRSAQLSALGVFAGVAINSIMESVQEHATSLRQRAFFLAVQYLLCMVTIYILLSYSALRVSQDGKGNFSNIFFTVIFFSVQRQLGTNLTALLEEAGWVTKQDAA
jgi:hypothetical protein